MKLFICEKPSQARDIAKVLGATKSAESYIEGNGVRVTWCLGHLLGLAYPDEYCKDLKPWRMEVLPVLPEKWILNPNPKTTKQLNAIKDLLQGASEVVVATDADREGDVIGREVLEYFNYKGPVSRLWLSALDDASIKKALSNIRPGESTYPLYLAGLGRQRADWIIGMNMSMATTCLFSKKGGLSVGRVQTPTLALVVKRDREIEGFKPKDYFTLKAKFAEISTLDEGGFWATWQAPDSMVDEEGRVIQKQYIDMVVSKIQQGSDARVIHFSEVKKSKKAPVCFSLSGLQKLASSKFGYSAKDTLSIAQALYEKHKATTYPRTDCGYLPESQFTEASFILSKLRQSNPELNILIDKASSNTTFKSDVWNDAKVTAHHGIIPTSGQVDKSKMDEREQNLYDLICRYYIAQFLGDYEYSSRKVEIECQQEKFVANSNIPLVNGWREAITDIDEDNKENGEIEILPIMTEGLHLKCKGTKPEAKKTTPPARFTEGTLIDAMKNIAKYVENPEYKKLLRDTSGIGTEATRANIIEALLDKEYLMRTKKILVSTEKGRQIIDILPGVVKDPIMTAQWEQVLDDISTGKGSLDSFIQLQKQALEKMMSALVAQSGDPQKAIGGQRPSDYPCPICGKGLIRRKGQYGFFWSCSGYPDCKGMMSDQNGKPVPKKQVEISDTTCPTCGDGKLVKRKGKKGDFWGCSTYPKCKAAFAQKPN